MSAVVEIEVVRMTLTRAGEREGSLAEMAQQGQRFFAEGRLPGKLVTAHFVASWRTLLERGMGEIFVLRENGEVIGALGALVYPDMYDGEPVATEAFWWVKPERRGQGMRLLQEFEEWARECGCRRMLMVHLESLQPMALGRIYERRGYVKAETHYLKEVVGSKFEV